MAQESEEKNFDPKDYYIWGRPKSDHRSSNFRSIYKTINKNEITTDSVRKSLPREKKQNLINVKVLLVGNVHIYGREVVLDQFIKN